MKRHNIQQSISEAMAPALSDPGFQAYRNRPRTVVLNVNGRAVRVELVERLRGGGVIVLDRHGRERRVEAAMVVEFE